MHFLPCWSYYCACYASFEVIHLWGARTASPRTRYGAERDAALWVVRHLQFLAGWPLWWTFIIFVSVHFCGRRIYAQKAAQDHVLHNLALWYGAGRHVHGDHARAACCCAGRNAVLAKVLCHAAASPLVLSKHHMLCCRAGRHLCRGPRCCRACTGAGPGLGLWGARPAGDLQHAAHLQCAHAAPAPPRGAWTPLAEGLAPGRCLCNSSRAGSPF